MAKVVLLTSVKLGPGNRALEGAEVEVSEEMAKELLDSGLAKSASKATTKKDAA